MKKLTKSLASIAVAAVLLGAGPAGAQSVNPAYHTVFYSDATHTTQVGYLIWTGCDAYNNPTYRLVGTYTYFTEDEPNGYCVDGDMQPL